MSHVRYIDKTREYYQGEGYEKLKQEMEVLLRAKSQASVSWRARPSQETARQTGRTRVALRGDEGHAREEELHAVERLHGRHGLSSSPRRRGRA